MAVSNFIPWGLHPLRPWIKTELLKRSAEVGMSADQDLYAGPRTAWMRFFSNGTGVELDKINNLGAVKREGFVMGGVHGFNDSYGFNSSGQSIIGYDANGKEHTVPSSAGTSFPHRPPPGVESIEVSLYGGQNASFSGLCRKARVNWKCYSLDQLDYLTPYFLSPKVTSVIEWGWNTYKVESLMDLTRKQEILDTMLDGKRVMDRIERSNGNYDMMIGFIFDYGFTLNALGGYDCFTEFVNANWLVEGQEYKSASNMREKTLNKKKTITPTKTFIEFVNEDINNLIIKDNDKNNNLFKFSLGGKSFSVTPSDAKTKYFAGSERKTWIRMDLVEQIFNQYFSLVFKDVNGTPVGRGGGLDISGSIACGHPALKSVDREILVPNQFAPRFITKESENYLLGGTESRPIGSVKFGNDPYSTLFGGVGIQAVISDKKLTENYDDLRSIINSGKDGRSFPMYEPGGPVEGVYSEPGMWGYLSDLFISTDLMKEITEENYTAFRILQVLCEKINNALCGVTQLKVVPHQVNSKLTIVDMNYNPHANRKASDTLVRFSPGSVNSAFMMNVSFNVKLSQVMASQMVAQSSAGIDVDKSQTKQNVEVQKINRFIGNDRLYDVGTVDIEIKSTNSEEGDESDQTKPEREISGRYFSTERFWPYQKGSKTYILVEPDETFMRTILSEDNSGKVIYINSPMMPGTKFTMETLGISGFTFLGQFTLDHVPKTYAYENCVWQIADIKQKVIGGTWTTEITADCRPLSYVKPI